MAEEQRRDGVIEFPHARLTAGGRLRAAREAAGLSLADMAGRTKIPMRMLTLIEEGNYAALPAKAYATGFTRTYARALGLDEAEILAEVRREMGQADPSESRLTPTFEPGDPARVPSARFAWVAAGLALIVLLAGLLLWRSYYAPAVTLPPLLAPEPTPAQPPAASVVVPLPAPSAAVPAAPVGSTTGPAGGVALPGPGVAPTSAVPPAPASAAPRAPQRRQPSPAASPAAAASPSAAAAPTASPAAAAAPMGMAAPVAPPAAVPQGAARSTTQ